MSPARKPHTKTFHLAGQPRHRSNRVANTASLRPLATTSPLQLSTASILFDVDVGWCYPRRTEHEARRRGVVGDGVA